MIGQTISHYKIVEKIGEGGMGQVFKAWDERLNRYVAIKVLPTDKGQDPSRRERFLREARAASALNHPNIVTIYDILAETDDYFLIMEFISGQTIGTMMSRGPMPIPQALEISGHIADALATAHEAGIVHRDLKPGNVMLTATGHVKLLDFGLAKQVHFNSTSSDSLATQTVAESLTMHNTILGTPRYMSPEQAEGRKQDTRSDIFTFGVVLYEMLTGQFAFHAPTTLSTLASVLRDQPRPIGEIVQGTPPELVSLIERCIRKDPDERYQQMRVVHQTLRAIAGQPAASKTVETAPIQRSGADDETVLYHPPAPPKPPVKPVPEIPPAAGRKSPLRRAVVAGGIVVLGLIAAGLIFTRQRQPEPAPQPPPAAIEEAKQPPAATPTAPPPQSTPQPPPQPPPQSRPVSVAKTPPAVVPAIPKETPAPVAPPAPTPAVMLTLRDATPVQLSLSSPVSEDVDKGDRVSFEAVSDVSVDGAVVIAKGAAAKGIISEGARKKILGRKSNITMLFDTIETVDGKQVRLRELSAHRPGAERKPRVVGKLVGKDGASAVPVGTQYVAFIDGDVSVSAPKR